MRCNSMTTNLISFRINKLSYLAGVDDNVAHKAKSLLSWEIELMELSCCGRKSRWISYTLHAKL